MFKKLLIVLSISLLMVGCTSTQDNSTDVLVNETNDSISSKIIEGKTTKSEIRELFGEPVDHGIHNGFEGWSYSNEAVTTNPIIYLPLVGAGTCLAIDCVKTDKQNLYITFKNGIVHSFSFSKDNYSF